MYDTYLFHLWESLDSKTTPILLFLSKCAVCHLWLITVLAHAIVTFFKESTLIWGTICASVYYLKFSSVLTSVIIGMFF